MLAVGTGQSCGFPLLFCPVSPAGILLVVWSTHIHLLRCGELSAWHTLIYCLTFMEIKWEWGRPYIQNRMVSHIWIPHVFYLCDRIMVLRRDISTVVLDIRSHSILACCDISGCNWTLLVSCYRSLCLQTTKWLAVCRGDNQDYDLMYCTKAV